MEAARSGITRRSWVTWLVRSKRRTMTAYTVVQLVVLAAGAVAILLPFAWMFCIALKTRVQVYVYPPQWFPRPLLWRNFIKALTVLPFDRYFLNSAIISGSCIVGHALSSSMVGFGFARLRARGREALFLVVLATMMIPYAVTIVPSYLLFKTLGWIDTFNPLIVPAFLGDAFFIFLMRQFFRTLPLELDDAAKIDGCTYLDIYWRIAMPLAKPALAAVAAFSFMWTWNDFMAPLIYLNSADKYTITLGLNSFKNYYPVLTQWNLLMAASIVAVIPCVVLYFFAQRYFVQGVVMTGLKG